jgi:hypothetical protein
MELLGSNAEDAEAAVVHPRRWGHGAVCETAGCERKCRTKVKLYWSWSSLRILVPGTKSCLGALAILGQRLIVCLSLCYPPPSLPKPPLRCELCWYVLNNEDVVSLFPTRLVDFLG